MSASARLSAMNVALRQPMSVEEFLEWEERQELRYEFDGFQPIAMAGGTRTHGRIQRNLTISVGGRLLDRPCEFLGSDFRLRIDIQVRYPDGMVFCTLGQGTDTSARDPVVVFEVLSNSTADTDRITKVREYQSLPSVQRYVLLEQERIAATVLVRAGDVWPSQVLLGDEILRMPEIGLEFPLSELYRGVDFGDREPEPAAE